MTTMVREAAATGAVAESLRDEEAYFRSLGITSLHLVDASGAEDDDVRDASVHARTLDLSHAGSRATQAASHVGGWPVGWSVARTRSGVAPFDRRSDAAP